MSPPRSSSAPPRRRARRRSRTCRARSTRAPSFVQTQMVLDAEAFAAWLEPIREAGLCERAAILPGLVIPRSAALVERLAGFGALVADGVAARAEQGEGLAVACELAEQLLAIPGVAGLHLMPLGAGPEAMTELALHARTHVRLKLTTEALLHTTLSSATKTVTIGHDQPFCIIGERINPTGRKAFAAQLRAERPLAGGRRRARAGRRRRARAGRQHGRAADRRARPARARDPARAGALRPADLHRLIDRRGARGRARRLPGQGARQLGDGRGRSHGADPAARQEVRRGRDHSRERRDRHSRDRRAAPRDHPQDREGRGRAVRDRARGHRDRPARDADRRRSDDGHDDDRRRSARSTTSSGSTCASAPRTSASGCRTATP